MKRKIKQSKQFILGFVTALALSMGVVQMSSAEGLLKDISAQISYEINMKLNNKDFNPVDGNGAALRPIIYNNRTYLPVRALCDAFKVKLEWEGSTKTIWMGDKGEKISIGKEVFNTKWKDGDVYYTENPELLYLGGKLFKSGLRWKDNDKWRYFCFDAHEGKMDKFGGTIYLDKATTDGDQYRVVFRSLKDDGEEVLAIYDVEPGKPYEFEFDLNNANCVVLDIDYHDTDETRNFSLLDLYYKN